MSEPSKEYPEAEYNAIEISNWFLDRTRTSNLFLHKYLYIAQGFYLGFNDKPLFKDDIAVKPYDDGEFGWIIVPSVYKKTMKHGTNTIPKLLTHRMKIPEIPQEDRDTNLFLEAILDKYGELDHDQFCNNVYRTDSPISRAFRRGQKVVSLESMDAYFTQLLEENKPKYEKSDIRRLDHRGFRPPH